MMLNPTEFIIFEIILLLGIIVSVYKLITEWWYLYIPIRVMSISQIILAGCMMIIIYKNF